MIVDSPTRKIGLNARRELMRQWFRNGISLRFGAFFSCKGVRFKQTFVVVGVVVLPAFRKRRSWGFARPAARPAKDRRGFYGGGSQASRQVPLPKIPPGLPLEKGGANPNLFG